MPCSSPRFGWPSPPPWLCAQEVPTLFVPLATATLAAHWSLVRSRGHYPSDVFVGGALAVVIAVAAWLLWPPGQDAGDEAPQGRTTFNGG